MTKYILEHLCIGCSATIKILVHDEKIRFSVLDKLFSEKDILSDNGYVVCPFCHKLNNIKVVKIP